MVSIASESLPTAATVASSMPSFSRTAGSRRGSGGNGSLMGGRVPLPTGGDAAAPRRRSGDDDLRLVGPLRVPRALLGAAVHEGGRLGVERLEEGSELL